MRWPWRKVERRSYSAIITDALESAVADTASGAASAALEAAGGYLARELSSATVTGPEWAREAVSREWRAFAARETLRNGESVSAISMGREGRVSLIPVSDFHWRGQAIDEDAWSCQCTLSMPYGTMTREFGRAELVALRWSLSPFERYRGRGPTALAGSTANLAKNAEARLNEEASKAVAQILVMPEGNNPNSEDAKALRTALTKGALRFVETTAGGRGDRAGAPQSDWQPRHIGPQMKAELVHAARDSYFRMLDACGLPSALCDAGADGTAQREALRRARLNFVEPFAACLADELSRRLEVEIGFEFDPYALDMVSRAQVVSKLTAAGVDIGVAMAAVGLAE